MFGTRVYRETLQPEKFNQVQKHIMSDLPDRRSLKFTVDGVRCLKEDPFLKTLLGEFAIDYATGVLSFSPSKDLIGHTVELEYASALVEEAPKKPLLGKRRICKGCGAPNQIGACYYCKRYPDQTES